MNGRPEVFWGRIGELYAHVQTWRVMPPGTYDAPTALPDFL